MSLAKEFLSGSKGKRRCNVTALPMGRLKVERWFTLPDKEDEAWHTNYGKDVSPEDEDLTIKVFGGYGLLDGADNLDEALGEAAASTLASEYTHQAYKDCRLTHEECAPTKPEFELYQVYETLTDEWALVDVEKPSTTESGLETIERIQVAQRGKDLPYTKDQVGELTLDSGHILGRIEDQSTDRMGQVRTIWVEPGILSIQKGYVGGDQTCNISAIGMDASDVVNEVSTARAHLISSHELVSESTGEHEGLRTTEYQFNAKDFEVRKRTENNLLVIQQTELSLTDFKEGSIGSEEKFDPYANRIEIHAPTPPDDDFTILIDGVIQNDLQRNVGEYAQNAEGGNDFVWEITGNFPEGTEVEVRVFDGWGGAWRQVPYTLKVFWWNGSVQSFERGESLTGTSDPSLPLYAQPLPEPGVSYIPYGNETPLILQPSTSDLLLLTGEEIDNGGRVKKRIRQWAEPGILNVSVDRASPKQRVTVQAVGLAWDDISSQITEVGADHRLIEDGISDYEGFRTNSYTFEVTGSEEITIGENGLRGVRVFEFSETEFTKADSGTVGTSTLDHQFTNETVATLTLASIEVNNKAPLKTRTRTYVEPGTLSDSTDEKYGGVLELRTIRALGLSLASVRSELGITTDLLDQSKDNSEGLETNTYRFASGSGEISRTTTTQGVLTRTAITSLNEDPTPPANAALIDAKTDVRELGVFYTHTFVAGQGEVSRTTDPDLNGTITRTTIVSINQVPSASGNLADSKVDARDGYTLYTSTFITGQGEVSRSDDALFGGTLTKTTIVAVNEEPTGPTGSILVDTQLDSRDGYTLYTYIYYAGSGVISTTDNDEFGGALTKTTIVAVNEVPTHTGALVNTETQSRDGYTLYTYTFASGSGQVSTATSTEFNGKLTKTTVTSINVQPTKPTGAALIDAKTSAGDGYILYTSTFASGSGEVSRTTDTDFNGALTKTRVVSINQIPNATGAVAESKVEARDGYMVYSYVFVTGSGEVSRDSDTRFNGALTVTTIVTVNVKPTGTGALVDTKVDARDGYTLYTYTYAEGSGEVSNVSASLFNGAMTRTTITSINAVPTGPVGAALVENDIQERDGYTVYRYIFVAASGTVSDTIETGPSTLPGSKIRTIVQFATAPTNTGELLSMRVEQENGYEKYTGRWLQVTESTIATYTDIVEVEEPGTVELLSEAVNIVGNESAEGSLAVLKATPRRQKRVKASVTIEITSNPPTGGTPAYDLGNISCSVTSVNTGFSVSPGRTVTNGNITTTGWQQNLTASARMLTYPGSYLVGGSSIDGSIAYRSMWNPREDGGADVGDVVRKTKLIGSGSSSDSGFVTSGVLKRNVRPLMTVPSGKTYFEVVTWEV